ncbi:MAG TPA: hypothetical protein VGD17_03775, partial [Chitinophagaceae bacterium]
MHSTPSKLRLLAIIFTIVAFTSCQKNDLTSAQEKVISGSRNDNSNGHLQQTKTFSSDVVIKWLNMELNMFRLPLPAGTSAPSADRALA